MLLLHYPQLVKLMFEKVTNAQKNAFVIDIAYNNSRKAESIPLCLRKYVQPFLHPVKIDICMREKLG